jgi:hypothetical protein
VSHYNNEKFDCIVVVSHGLELSANKINVSLSLMVNNLQMHIPIICPAPIWTNLQDFPCEPDCISILPRDARVHDTSIAEIVGEVTKLCYENGWRSLLVIALPEDQKICVQLLFAHGLHSTIVEYIPTP